LSQHAIAPPDKSARNAALSAGFTLIELAVVLVVIGLIVGGVLVGKELINAAAIRAQITQIERFNTAVHTFQVKYNCLPGDCANAGNFGFRARGAAPGQGDGNGVIEGVTGNPGTNNGLAELAGETVVFWEDLSAANLIEWNFNTAGIAVLGSAVTLTTTPNISAYLPTAKLGAGNYIYVYSTGGINYYGLSPATQLNNAAMLDGTLSVPVWQAALIDTKVDDGLPQSGRVTDQFDYGGAVEWGSGFGFAPAPGNAAAASSTSCYDNGGNAAVTPTYSMAQNGGAGANCALSFQFQ
jgi:prepilin-type N-terminal cleavage/methylation domain-containing protein